MIKKKDYKTCLETLMFFRNRELAKEKLETDAWFVEQYRKNIVDLSTAIEAINAIVNKDSRSVNETPAATEQPSPVHRIILGFCETDRTLQTIPIFAQRFRRILTVAALSRTTRRV